MLTQTFELPRPASDPRADVRCPTLGSGCRPSFHMSVITKNGF